MAMTNKWQPEVDPHGRIFLARLDEEGDHERYRVQVVHLLDNGDSIGSLEQWSTGPAWTDWGQRRLMRRAYRKAKRLNAAAERAARQEPSTKRAVALGELAKMRDLETKVHDYGEW